MVFEVKQKVNWSEGFYLCQIPCLPYKKYVPVELREVWQKEVKYWKNYCKVSLDTKLETLAESCYGVLDKSLNLISAVDEIFIYMITGQEREMRLLY